MGRILEGAEIDNRLAAIDLARVTTGGFGQVLPPVKICVRFQVSLPRIFDGVDSVSPPSPPSPSPNMDNTLPRNNVND